MSTIVTDTPEVIRDWLRQDVTENSDLFAAIGGVTEAQDRVFTDSPPPELKDAGEDYVIIKNLTEESDVPNSMYDIILQAECYPGIQSRKAARTLYRKVFGRLHGRNGTVDSGQLLHCVQQTNVGIVKKPEGDIVHVSKYTLSVEEEGS